MMYGSLLLVIYTIELISTVALQIGSQKLPILDTGPAYCLYQDRYRDDIILICGECIIFSFNTTTNQLEPIAGSNGTYYREDCGYRESTASTARLSSITDLVQTNKSSIVVSDMSNHCLRSIVNQTTSTFAGNCTIKGYRDGEMDRALFNITYGLILVNNTLLYISEFSRIRLIDLKTGMASTVAEGVNWPKYFACRDFACNNIYVTVDHGLISVNRENGNITSVLTEDSRGNKSLLIDPKHLQFITLDQIVIADEESRPSRLTTVNLIDKTATQLLKLSGAWSFAFIDANLYVGQNLPSAVTVCFPAADRPNGFMSKRPQYQYTDEMFNFSSPKQSDSIALFPKSSDMSMKIELDIPTPKKDESRQKQTIFRVVITAAGIAIIALAAIIIACIAKMRAKKRSSILIHTEGSSLHEESQLGVTGNCHPRIPALPTEALAGGIVADDIDPYDQIDVDGRRSMVDYGYANVTTPIVDSYEMCRIMDEDAVRHDASTLSNSSTISREIDDSMVDTGDYSSCSRASDYSSISDYENPDYDEISNSGSSDDGYAEPSEREQEVRDHDYVEVVP